MVRRVASKPVQAPPPPINFARNSPATCSNIEFISSELQRFWGVSKNDRDKLRAKCGWRWCRRCPWVSQSGPAAPSGCHRGLVCLVFGVLWCVLLQTSSIQGVFRVDFCPVVTNVVNSTAFSLIMVVFGLRLTTFVTGALVRRFESCWFDDVCNVGRPLAARPRALWSGPVGQAARLPETAIAFAGEKWAVLVQFSGAEVMVVSMVAVQGRAVVLSVSTSPCCCAMCAKKFALRGLMVGVIAKKFALHAQNTPKSAFLRLLGELFRGNAAGGVVLGEFFRANASGEAVLGELFRVNRPCAQVL